MSYLGRMRKMEIKKISLEGVIAFISDFQESCVSRMMEAESKFKSMKS